MNEIKLEKQETINQHYVPRFYMKNFSKIKGVGKKEKVLIGFYQFEDNLLKDNIPTKSICYKNYFYGEDCSVENDLAKKEEKWAKLINDIITSNEYSLNKDEEISIKEFAVFQYCRTLAIYNHHINIYNDIDGDKSTSFISPSEIIENCKEIIEVISDLKISVIKFNTEKKLITSDMPVILTNPFCSGDSGFAKVGTVILIPISPEIIIAIYDDKIYKSCNSHMVIDNEQDVINLNKYQVLSSEERILAEETKQLVDILEDKDIITKREKNIERRKTNFSYDGIGTLFAVKSRVITYDFELSFCKMPKYIKKVSGSCKENFKRTYSKDTRFALLVRCYKIPESIEKNPKLKKIDSLKFKKSYLNLQKFMDSYWDTPKEDRVMTPSLMENIKNVKTTYFDPEKNE